MRRTATIYTFEGPRNVTCYAIRSGLAVTPHITYGQRRHRRYCVSHLGTGSRIGWWAMTLPQARRFLYRLTARRDMNAVWRTERPTARQLRSVRRRVYAIGNEIAGVA